ncbi:FAD-dependent oxidoreductase [Pseudomonas sp. DP16D-R1]|uniref:FAD-dependent oxidoreductase n=1 Tax=Pseudomonas sp. DP16D-R1 TaxID=2075551 RepID=UPI000CD06882|nr:FAD-dependent oxidoreductase [Pseudomonas sp. DP16D-R1]POA77479.1 pyridine nucleotide-disulfide oxidoreductase [Pseudomonas sp. DP16D-R1]
MSNKFDLLLAGAGHAHLGVLRLWAGDKPPSGRIGLISPDQHAWYSGMLPALLTGRYKTDQCRIDLQPLCQAAGIEFISSAVTSLQPEANLLHLDTGETLQSEWLSLNLGSLPRPPESEDAGMELLPVKPFSSFISRWEQWQKKPQRLAILGGGAAGVELALALARTVPSLALFSAANILAGHTPALRGAAIRHLHQLGVELHERCPVDRILGGALISKGEIVWRGVRLILTTGASPLGWLCESGLSCNEQGFIQVSPTLQSVSHPQIFAAGDCANLVGTPRNGVYAVRQGPVLAANLASALKGELFTNYVPQRIALALLSDGEGGAMMSWAGFTAEGSFIGKWKDYLDRRFMTRHRASKQ